MNNINCLVVEGNITREPNFRTSPNGFPICKIPIAVNHYYKKAASGEYENEVSYFDVETFGKLAEICAKFSQKGRGLSVVGRLKQNRWKTPEGKNTSRVTIIAEKIEFKHPEAAVLAIVPSYYCLDGQEQEERPRPDQRAAQFEAHYIAFVGKKELKEKIQDSFDRSGKSIEQTFARPEALLSSFIPDNPDVLYDGCAVLDFGAETTTLSIFKGTEYLYTKVVAQGSEHITRLLTHQGITHNLAEKLKTQYGFASPDLVSDKDNLRMRIPLATGEAMNFTTREVAQLIQQKLDEILTPLLAGLSTFESRISVLYITGGGSLLQGMDSYLQSKTGVKVLYGSHALLLAPDTDDEFYNPRYSSLVGALILGSDYREAHPGQKIPPAKITDAVGDMLLKFFTDTETSTPTK